MGLVSDIGKGLGASGPLLVIGGIGGLILGPPILRMAGRIVRPAAKTVIRSGADAYRYTKHGLGDLVEETRAELGRPEPEAKPQRAAAKPPRRPARPPAKPGGHIGAHP